MKRFATLLAVALALVLGVQAAYAGWGAGACGTGAPPPQLTIDKWQSQGAFLGLTDDQTAQIKKIQQDYFNSTKDLRSKLQNSMFELRQLRWEKNPDQGMLKAKIDESNSLRSDLYNQSKKCREQIDSVLTPEQRAKLLQQRSGKGSGIKGGMFGL